MRRLVSAVLLVALYTSTAHAQEWVNAVNIYGGTVSCKASDGKVVPLLISEQAIALGGGGFAQDDPIKGPSIMLSPTRLQQLPRLGTFFLFYHECAHVALPIGIGLGTPASEINADCYAVKAMRKDGLITSWKDFMEALDNMKNSPGDFKGHLPGPERIRTAAQCANIPVVRDDSAVCQTLDTVFAGGNVFLKRFDFDQKYDKLLSGFVCSSLDDASRLRCFREIENEDERVSFANNLVNKTKSCLPTEFSHEKLTAMPEFMAIWTNGATNQSVSIHSDFAGQVVFEVVLEKEQ